MDRATDGCHPENTFRSVLPYESGRCIMWIDCAVVGVSEMNHYTWNLQNVER